MPKDHQIDLHIVFQQECAEFPDGDLQGQPLGEAIISRGDKGKGDAGAVVGFGKCQGFSVAGGKKGFLLVLPVDPDRACGVDHIFGIQLVARCDGGIAGGQRADGLAGLQQCGPGCFVDGAVHPAANHRLGVCGVDNGIGGHIDDIVADDGKGHKDPSFFFPVYAKRAAASRPTYLSYHIDPPDSIDFL